MYCEACNKSVATVHLTEIINKKKKELHLCEECAREKGVTIKSHFFNKEQAPAEPAIASKAKAAAEDALAGLSCSVCGITFAEFRASGRLGCANDYNVFKKGLLPLLEKIHGHTEHKGKVPVQVGERLERQKRLLSLRQALNRAIQKEEYEKAAEIRDQIYELEERG
jgi:protein arginine kinase activator